MTRNHFLSFALTATSALFLGSCGEQGNSSTDSSSSADSSSAGGDGSSAATERYVIGVIAKSQSNPVFQAARVGAVDAARDLGEQYGIDIQIEWRTPTNEDAQKQAEYVEQLASAGVDGIAISASDANLLTSSLNDAIEGGAYVVTFDSDVPDSDRIAYYGVDDKAAGAKVMEELAKVMDGEGVVGILSGNPNSANLSARVAGVEEKAAEYEGIEVRGTFYEPKETAADMAAKVQQVQAANPDISGWAFVGGWPLYTDNALDGVHETAKVVSMDPLRLPISYLKKGQVQTLVGQPYHGWGYQSVKILIEQLHNDKAPESEFIYGAFDIVTQENAEAFNEQWNEWLDED